MKRFLISKNKDGYSISELAISVEIDGVTTDIPTPVVIGNGRIYEGDNEPDEEQMAALFAPTYVALRMPEYADFRELLDALTKKASTDPARQAEGVAQEAAYYAHNNAVKDKYPKPSRS